MASKSKAADILRASAALIRAAGDAEGDLGAAYEVAYWTGVVTYARVLKERDISPDQVITLVEEAVRKATS